MHHFVTEMCTLLWQNVALWDMWLMHWGICATGLLYQSPVLMTIFMLHVNMIISSSTAYICYIFPLTKCFVMTNQHFFRLSVWLLSVTGVNLLKWWPSFKAFHYNDVIMTRIASQITSLTVVYSIVYSGADQRKHQSSASLAFVRGIHRGPVNSPHKGPVTRKMFPFDDVIMLGTFLVGDGWNTHMKKQLVRRDTKMLTWFC